MGGRFIDKITKTTRSDKAAGVLRDYLQTLAWEEWHAERKRGKCCGSAVAPALWQTELESYTLPELEKTASFFMEIGSLYKAEEDALREVLWARKRLLDREFKYTEKNVHALLAVNTKLMDCFEQAYAEAGRILKALQQNKNSNFTEDIDVTIRVTPYLFEDGNWPRGGVAAALEWVMEDQYRGMLEDDVNGRAEPSLYVSKELNWNMEGFDVPCLASEEAAAKSVFANEYICYAMHELADHSVWSVADIARIKELSTEIEVNLQHSCKVKPPRAGGGLKK